MNPIDRDLDLTVALFPGQGAYRAGALAALWERGADAVRGTFEVVDEVAKERLGQEVSSVLFQPSPPSPATLLQQAPDTLQLGIFATSVATHRLMTGSGARPSLHMGHSLGEVAALTCAGAYDLADATAVLCERISVVRAHDRRGGSLLALRCNRSRAERLVALIDHAGLVLAVDNATDQTVLSGPADAIGTAEAIARQLGITATPLRSPHPFHNPLLAGARRELAARLGAFERRDLAVPVYSPILGRFYRDGDDLADLLALHLVTPVGFRAALTALHTAGAGTFVEIGAGRVLTSLAEAALPGVHTVAPLAGRDDEAGLAAGADALRDPWSRLTVVRPVTAPAIVTDPDMAVPVTTGPVTITPFTIAPEAADPVAVTVTEPGDGQAAVAPARVGEVATSVTSAPADRDELAGHVRTLYAEAMEYPHEVFTDDVLLEADLGVDSVKQTELLSRLGDRFGLGAPPSGLRVADYDTFGKVVDFVATGVAGGAFAEGPAVR
ncbi:acyltransferase domain-containing protein [Streptomyces sp. NPDC048419]|uniref:acyltransferase domain-containing protein n=1 Tax=Streptomyces sp. NPDC048419 TaxID=3365547 RepID=UPI00371B1000